MVWGSGPGAAGAPREWEPEQPGSFLGGTQELGPHRVGSQGGIHPHHLLWCCLPPPHFGLWLLPTGWDMEQGFTLNPDRPTPCPPLLLLEVVSN